VKAIAKCQECGEVSATPVTQEELDMWVSGANVQSVWPSKSAEEREIVLQSQYVELLNRPMRAVYVCENHDFWEE